MLYDKWERVVRSHLSFLCKALIIQGSRSPRKRSLLGVNEHFEGEHNAAIFVLYGFYLREFIRILAFTNAIARIRLISISLSAWWGF